MFDQVDNRQLLGAVAVFGLAIGAAFGAGYLVNGGSGAVVADGSADTVRDAAQSVLDQQVQQQQQQLQTLANQTENVTEDDLSYDAEVTDVSQSEFGSLYAVTVQITGTVPAQQGMLGGSSSQLQEIDQEMTLYMSPDGRYLFQEPQDLEQPAQQQQPQPPQ